VTSPIELILGAAESAIGVGYKWGGNSLASGVDCSGLVQQAFAAAGFSLPRVSNQQAQVGNAIQSMEFAQPGDLLFWDNSSRNNGADHVAIYIGNGMMIEAYATGQPIRVTQVRGGAQIRRVVGVVPQGQPKPVQLGPNQDRTYTSAAVSGTAAPAPTTVTAQGAPEGGLGDGLAPNASPEETEKYIKEHFPDVAAFMGDPAIHMLLVAAARDDWSDERLIQAVHQTDYWKTHGPASRQFDVQLATDSALAHQRINDAIRAFDQAFQRQGVHKSAEELGQYAKDAIRGGWETSQADIDRFVANTLGKDLQAGTGLPAGESANTADSILTLARRQGLPLSQVTAQQWALDVAAGRETMDGINAKITALAKSRWQNDPDVLKTIENGGTAADYFQPYNDVVANTLELNPQAVDVMNDPKYSSILQYFDPATKEKRSMTLGEVMSWARHQDAFKNTRQYQQGAGDLRSNLTRFFGAEAA
jgi:hypothetical protein